MPKVAQSLGAKIRSWIAPYNKEFEVFTTDGTVVYCNICSKGIGCERKSQIDAHVITGQHTGALARKRKSRREKQTLLASQSKNVFFMDLCYALVASNIPLHKLSADPFRNFLQKYTQNQVPTESGLRKTYIPLIFEESLRKIKEVVGENYVYISVDETTDARGIYIANLLIGVLAQETFGRAFLIASQQLNKTNHETISRFINTNLRRFYEGESFEDRILLLLSDAASYMIKAGKGLRLFYANLHHVTCVVHGMHRLAEEARAICPDVNKLVNAGKKMFLKAPSRLEVYQEIMNKPLPPQPVLTRWGTWLSAALFYAENFQQFKIVVQNLEEDAESVTKAKSLVQNQNVLSQLTFLQANLSFLPQSIEDMMVAGQTLRGQFEILNVVEEKIKSIPGGRGVRLQNKFDSVFDKNSGLTFLREILKVQSGEQVTTREINDMEPTIINSFAYAPLTSVDVERSFSYYKHLLSDRRYSFNQDNLEKHLVVGFNKI